MRIGSGAGFSADRLDPALRLIERGRLDAIGFECLAERTLAMAQEARAADPEAGYDRFLEVRMRACLPLLARTGTRLVSNMGAANPAAAARKTAALAGTGGPAVAWIEGDDVRHLIEPSTPVADLGCTVADVGRKLIAANAYLGAEHLLPALDTDALVILTGRVADPSLFLASLAHRYGWAMDDWPRLGAGTLVGHLLECAGQVTGGYFADPGVKPMPGMAELGFPLAEVEADGGAVITKLPEDGGLVSEATVKEQILYEVHDPARYLTPDVAADFSRVTATEEGPDRVRVAGATGRERPDRLKVTLAFDGGLQAEAGISYAGLGAAGRAQLAADILRQRLNDMDRLRIDIIGLASLHASLERPRANAPPEPDDVRVHVTCRSDSPETARRVLWEVEALYTCGPAGGAGFRGHTRRVFVTHDAYVPREAVSVTTELIRP